ncbi:MAG: acyltransferase [Sphingomonadales bacterium]|nr:acyltransferase [Sphingomonadales bacterium]MDE2172064.1 acyltransferase [Sphingomonadales bacterium]
MPGKPVGRTFPPISNEAHLSRAIGVARVLCIMGIVYVHAWTGRNGADLNALSHTPQGMLRWALVELLGRSSVPLLSMVSGWLVGPSLLRRGGRVFLADKARSILAPMVLWNALAIILVSGAARAGFIYAPQPTSPGWVIDELLCLTRPDDINVQIPFLRDLFVCMMAAPLLNRCPDKGLWFVIAVALAGVMVPVAGPVLQRPSILMFFVIGMLARRHDLAAWMGARPLRLMAMPYAVMAALKIWLEVRDAGEPSMVMAGVIMAGVDLAMRGVTALFFWSLAWRLAKSRLAAPLLRVEPYMFLMFCAHLIMIWLAGPAIGLVSGPIGAPLYPLFLLLQPLLVLGASLLLGRGLIRMAPGAARVLSGGRLGRG